MGRKEKRHGKRKKSRIHCPKCSSKRLTLLNKPRRIWECLDSRCNHKFMVLSQGTGTTYLALKPEDVKIIEEAGKIPTKTLTEKDNPKEINDQEKLDDVLSGF